MNGAGRLKVALIGAGAWGMQHARVFAERPDVDLCAVVGRTQENTRARAEEFGASFYLDIQEMLDRERPDLVSLCLPNLGHFGPTLQVIREGYPLLVEKPLVFDMGEADSLVNEAAKRGLFFALNFNHRYAEPVRMAQEAIQKGLLGDVVFATWRFGGEPSETPHPHANLIETQCHGFDMLEHLCGRIASIMAQMTEKTGHGYSTHALALRFVDGAVGTLVGSYDSSYAYGRAHTLEINGTEGRVLVEDTVRRYTFQAAGEETARVWQAGYFNDRDRSFHETFDRHVDDVLGALRRGEEPPIHARAGRRALELAYAAIESFETGERVATA
ncbi:MAG TPA: Gfo/Idh/MocA family oxidoreductase [Rubrobacter sp.]|nr:Gfo/Idh/MocA family oxidoreductase [Rubrobacter sp.]